MSEITLSAELRSEFGKGAARRLRRANKIPAVVYGQGTEPLHIALPGHETLLALRQVGVVLNIEIEGQDPRRVIAKQVQRDPVKRTIEHVDLILVAAGE